MVKFQHEKVLEHRAYHSWQLVFRNPADFTHEIWQISPRFHPWNLADFTQISPVKSTQNLIKASVSAKTLQFDECRVGAMTKDFMKSAWNPPDFKITSFCVMIKYRSFFFRKTKHKEKNISSIFAYCFASRTLQHEKTFLHNLFQWTTWKRKWQ